jgi:cytochrome c-type biogenesis protein
MDLMLLLEAGGASNFPLIAAFFIGIMMAISPCPLITNITAIAYTSRKINNRKKTFWVGLAYTIGRMFTYVALASMIVYIGVSVQGVSSILQTYGEKFIGPLMIIIGLVMLEVIKLDFKIAGPRLDRLKESLSEKGYLGSFLLGVVFALAFCPFSAVLFFGMLIPLALKFSDGILIPSAFAFATGLPVILMSLLLVGSASRVGTVINKVQEFEKRMRQFVAVVFILAGIYYVYLVYLA